MLKKMIQTTNVLTIAGSDSCSGAGIQADIKTIHSLDGYALTALTALTAQNTTGVFSIMPASSEIITAQLNAVHNDLPIHAVKVGMLFNEDTISVVSSFLKTLVNVPIVVDPVMVATSGDLLLKREAINKLVNQLLPLASIITPNLEEAKTITQKSAMNDIISILKEKTSAALLIKDVAPNSEQAKDILCYQNKEISFEKPRISSKNTHGTGCTLSSAIATKLAKNKELIQAVAESKEYIFEKITNSKSLQFGSGHGPLIHLT